MQADASYWNVPDYSGTLLIGDIKQNCYDEEMGISIYRFSHYQFIYSIMNTAFIDWVSSNIEAYRY